MSRAPNLVGQKFSRLLVLERSKNKGTRSAWKCLCDCGSMKIIQANNLMQKSIMSCGCLRRERARKRLIEKNTTHGLSYTGAYKTWISMIYRCTNPKHKFYKHYGDRGIKICEEWFVFEKFYEDMGDRPKGLTIDRINNNKGYSKKNCRWISQSKQCSNKRNNVFLTIKGKKMTITEASRVFKVNYSTLWYRVFDQNLDHEKAVGLS